MHHRRSAIVYLQFFQDRGNVVLHRLITDLERFSDFFVAVATGDIVEYLYLSAGERRIERLHFRRLFSAHRLEGPQHSAGYIGSREYIVVNDVYTPAYTANRIYQLVGGDILKQIGCCAELHGLK